MEKRVKFTLGLIYFVAAFIAPLSVLGQITIPELISKIGDTLKLIIQTLFALATIIFLWGVVVFMATSSDPAKRSKARSTILWSIVGMAIMAAAWGAAELLVQYFEIPLNPPAQKPPPIFDPI